MQQRKSHLWPWEDEGISPVEYIRSLQGLSRFLEQVDLRKLQTLEDVSAVASLIGHDLRALAIAKGQKIEKRTELFEPGASEPIQSIEKEYVLTISFGDQEVMLVTGNQYTCISKRRIIGFQRYQNEELRVKLPADRDIAIGDKPNVDEASIYAIDLRGNSTIAYHPTLETDNPEIQQGFAHVLKDTVRAVMDIAALLP